MERSGRRASWDVVPRGVFAALAHELGASVTPGPLIAGGFSPGPAGPCVLADGRRIFVKTCGPELNADTPALIRREAEVLAALPTQAPAPRLLALVDVDGWVALAVEFVPGRTPVAPLGVADVTAVLALVERLAQTDAPPGAVLAPAMRDHGAHFWAWRKAAEDDALAARLDRWSHRHLSALVEREAQWPDAVAGTRLVHGDLRTDNVVLGADGVDLLVDWPSAGIGAPWVDLVGLLPSFHLDGAPAPAELFDAHPVGRAAPAEQVDCFLAALAGYFTRQSLLPSPPGLPTVRSFQAAQGAVARRWLADRLAWR